MHEGIRYSCDECDWMTQRAEKLKIHKEDKHLGLKHFCGQCGVLYNTKKSLDRHIKDLHHSRISFCNDCDFQSSMKREFIRHRILHKKQCQQCDYTATHEKNMKIHIQAIHEKSTYPCEICPYKSSTPRSLSNHQKSKHPAWKKKIIFNRSEKIGALINSQNEAGRLCKENSQYYQ